MDVLGQCFDANRLRRIVAGIKDVEVQLLGIEECPVLAFARDVRIESCGGSLRNQRTPRPGDDADALHAFGAEGKQSWCCAEHLRNGPAQVFALAAVLAPHADRRAVIRSELTANRDSQQSREHAVVADFRMAIERQVSGVERDVSFDQSSKPTIGGTNKRPETTPK